MTNPTYPMNVFWCDDDAAWIADAPDLEICSALGDTPHDAVAELELAIQAWIDAAASSGRTVPPPSQRVVRA